MVGLRREDGGVVEFVEGGLISELGLVMGWWKFWFSTEMETSSGSGSGFYEWWV